VTWGAGSAQALICGERELTFAQLDDRAGRVQAVLQGLGIEPGDRVAAMLPNDIEFFEVGIGAARAGAPVVPVNWHLKGEEVHWLVHDSAAKVVVAHADFADSVRQAVADQPGTGLLLVGGGSGGPEGESYEAATAAASPAAGELSSPTYLYYTSGTTGRPRGVERDGPPPDTNRLHAGLAAMWGLTGDDVWLASSPLYHAANAYSYTVLGQGGTAVVLKRWDAREWLRQVEAHRVTACFMVPAQFIRLLEVPEEERAKYDLSSLRLILHSAAPCPVDVKWQILDALPSAQIWEFYGATEGGATRISSDDWRTHPGSVGHPWPGVEVRVLDPDGTPCAPGETGLVYIRPPGGGEFHYRNDDAKTAGAWRDGAFTVGDVGHLDDDGYLYLTDRSSDLVIRGGVNIYPAEIEAVLQRHPGVVDCAVFGIPDARLGEQLKALVEARPSVTVDDLMAFCRQHLADFKVPREVEIVETLPRDAMGKVAKVRLRDVYRS
jgi:long-chain acyl-CoA synthetase